MTMQTSDNLIWHELTHSVIVSPKIQQAFPEVIFPKFDFVSSACWRGYVATWLIDNEGWLKLSKIQCNFDEDIGSANRFYEIFASDKPVAAFRFSGDVTVGFGEDVQSHGVYLRSYPNYRVFSFADGKLTYVKEHDRAWWVIDHQPYELPDFLKKS